MPVSQDTKQGIGLETAIHNASRGVASARRMRRIGISVIVVGMTGYLLFSSIDASAKSGIICLMVVFIGGAGILIGSHLARRAVKNLQNAIEYLEVSKWLDDSGELDLEAMLTDLQDGNGIEIREGGAAYFLQRGRGNFHIAEGKGGVEEWKKEQIRVDAMGPWPDIEAVMIEPRPAEKVVEEANAKRAEEANEAFLRAEKSDVDLIEAGLTRLGEDLGGPATSSERP